MGGGGGELRYVTAAQLTTALRAKWGAPAASGGRRRGKDLCRPRLSRALRAAPVSGKRDVCGGVYERVIFRSASALAGTFRVLILYGSPPPPKKRLFSRASPATLLTVSWDAGPFAQTSRASDVDDGVEVDTGRHVLLRPRPWAPDGSVGTRRFVFFLQGKNEAAPALHARPPRGARPGARKDHVFGPFFAHGGEEKANVRLLLRKRNAS